MIARRNFIRGAIATIAARPGKAQEVPNSVGTGHPKLKAPAHACDCHMHIYDPARFPFAPNANAAPTRAAVPQYRMLQNRIGTTRVVIVTPRNYRVDNRAMVDLFRCRLSITTARQSGRGSRRLRVGRSSWCSR